MQLVLYTSAFCTPCASARATLTEAQRLVPSASVVERDIVRYEDEAVAAGIRTTPTIVITGADGVEVFRASGAPTLNQVLTAIATTV